MATPHIPLVPKNSDQNFRSKSCDTACSSNSSCFFRKRRPMNPLAGSFRSALSKSTTGNAVRQRVLSAKLLKLKTVQNQLNDANYHLAEVSRENQVLKLLQKRQDKALTKYEGTNAELPRLLQSHEEEIRALTEKNKMLKKTTKDLAEQLKHKSEEVVNLKDQLKHFERLDKDKHLLEREKLIEQLEDYKVKLRKADEEIVTLNRKLSLESRSSKQKLNSEAAKHKLCQKELAQALVEVEQLTKQLESKDKLVSNGRKRFMNLPPRQSHSMVTLSGRTPDFDSNQKNPVSEVKLEPIQRKDSQSDNTKEPNGILKSPSESIKARLSSSGLGENGDEPPKLTETKEESGNWRSSRPSSSQKLEKISLDLQNTIRKVESNASNRSDIDKRLGDYCMQAIDSVKKCSEVVEIHKKDLKNSKSDTDKIEDSINELKAMESKLKQSHLLSLHDRDLNFVSQILNEELSFQKKYARDKNDDNRKEPAVGLNDKKKLLATLRAIDNGDNVDSFEGGPQRGGKLIQELFGDVD